ncbi:hypothetical protein [Spiroplasma endosymbiont of Danaus chrysippus]|uniref:hypothetical protein n=1 Tax=Spiroplasma endosymbiont of Danaus chrysippus TaxID=2691041 RepID=UPI0013CBD44C|nr:hypothetical protein [Spiroplasma endosymbiont of Danaus chrysippus]CAB1053457.1 hypothetical protein [Spiroplasma endosymbiont of Danaus chrysippus]
MNNYLLSIDPSIKNTGFTLWKPCCKHNKSWNEECNVLIDKECLPNIAIPVLIISYDFNKYQHYDFIEKVIEPLTLKASEDDFHYKCSKYRYWLEDFDVIIERGFNNNLNARSSEKMQALRGHIFSLLYQYYNPEKHGVLPKQWQNWYLKEYKDDLIKLLKIELKTDMTYITVKWSKELSILLCNFLIKQNNWNITISNHDEADSLLIGWYYLNKE